MLQIEVLQGTAGKMRGTDSGCAAPSSSSSSLSTPPEQLHMNISLGDAGLQQEDGVEMQLHHLSSPLPSFHPSIPRTFHVAIECGRLPVTCIGFLAGSLCYYLLDRSHPLPQPHPHPSTLQPHHCFICFHILFLPRLYFLIPIHTSDQSRLRG